MGQTKRTIRGDLLQSFIAAAVTLMAIACLHAAGSESRAPASALPRIKVSPNGRFLITENQEPFFWLGDTGWWMTGISPEEVDVYLAKREKQQFNVIQFHCGRLVKDYAGRLPFRGNDALAPDEEYWRNIDSIVSRAGDHGLYIALVPLWGEEYGRLFGSDAAKAGTFGQWIGARYASRTNVLWIASGEHDSINGFRIPITAAQKAVLTAAARGIREATGGRQLITVHPGVARTSSSDFHNESWLDFNMLQSGHQMDSEAYKLAENHALITHDYGLTPVKPVLDGEPMYEDTPDAIWIERNVDKPRADAATVRRKAYWSVFAGACGHTYGNNNVYGFFVPPSPGFVQKLPEGPGNRESWKTALDAPGGAQLVHLRALIESRPFLTQIPDPSLLDSPPGAGNDRVSALRGDGYAMFYTPLGRSFSVRLDRLGWRDATLTWFDPRSGQHAPAGNLAAAGVHEFHPPSEPEDGNDWVLVLERRG
ncbi:MAG: glycoside hydrolase family 140 protein [Pirellulaceae bacterium]